MSISKIDRFRENFVSSAASSVEDSFYPTIGIKFDFFPRLIEGESNQPGLLTGTARKFFIDRGDDFRVLKLDYFVSMLRYISVERPWFVSKINGMASLMKINMENGSRLESNTVLEIGLKETVDLKIMAMLDAYRSTVYDKKFMRVTLPKNLMRFDMKIYVTDARLLVEPDGKTNKKGKMKIAEDTSGVVVFNLFDCEFMTEDWSSMFGDMDNESKPTVAKQMIRVKVGRIYEQYNLPTQRPLGLLGSGYASNDFDSDIAFLGDIFRLNSLNDAELGNVFDVDRDLERIEAEKNRVDKDVIESTNPTFQSYYKRRYLDGNKASGSESYSPNGDEFIRPFVESNENKTRIDQNEIDDLNNNPITNITKEEIISATNTSEINKITVEQPNNGPVSISRIDIESVQNNTTVITGDDEGVSGTNNNTVSNIDGLGIESVQNNTVITKSEAVGYANKTSIDELSIESTENSTKIEKLTIESAPNRTFISKLNIESNPNRTFIDG